LRVGGPIALSGNSTLFFGSETDGFGVSGGEFGKQKFFEKTAKNLLTAVS
jgi:hypothetical protein